MWENMLSSSLLVAGAVVLFAVFTVFLFLYERREEKKKNARAVHLRVIRYEKSSKPLKRTKAA